MKKLKEWFANFDTNYIFFACVALSLVIIVYCVGGEVINLGSALVDDTLNNVKRDTEEPLSYINDMSATVGGGVKPVVDEFSRKYGDEINGDSNKGTASNTATGELVRVVDGNTFILRIDGKETSVRLIGVDTSVCSSSTDIIKDNIKEGSKLTIEYDTGRTDTSGNTLAYIYLSSGKMIQDWLLENGYAKVSVVQPNTKYSLHFAELEEQAKEYSLGVWGN